MIKALWIINKYVTFDIYEKNYLIFLKNLQEKLLNHNIELHYIFFNKNLYQKIDSLNCHYINNSENKYNESEIIENGLKLEKKYHFTFKQSSFADIIQNIYQHKNLRNIDIPYKYFSNFSQQINNFIFLEEIILQKNIDVIFSDVSPEAEMEFGRIIGNYYNKLVIKDYEGAFLGRSVFLKSNKFGQDEVINCDLNNDLTYEESQNFINDFIKNKRLPYTYPSKTIDKKQKFVLKLIFKKFFSKNIAKDIYKIFINFYYFLETNVFKKLLYHTFDKNINYFFFGLHLNQESTMVLRSQPYTNQIVLLEMLSRVLPINHYIYVREHPHWKSTFPLKYLIKVNKFNNIKLISPDISIHDILSNSKGIITYNSTTGIESLFYKKPVLSFASNIYYKNHNSVLFCNNLYSLGENIINLLNTKVDDVDTIKFLQKLHKCSYNFWLGSYFFITKEDAINKANLFSLYLSKAIKTCNNG